VNNYTGRISKLSKLEGTTTQLMKIWFIPQTPKYLNYATKTSPYGSSSGNST
jgi:hypothetical protein